MRKGVNSTRGPRDGSVWLQHRLFTEVIFRPNMLFHGKKNSSKPRWALFQNWIFLAVLILPEDIFFGGSSLKDADLNEMLIEEKQAFK